MTTWPVGFRCTREGNERLIVPVPGQTPSRWLWEHRWLRSLHLDDDGHIISIGYPKFMNLGEGNPPYLVTPQDLVEARDVSATLKLDGSLLIRFVHNGVVRFRTRGSMGYSHQPNAWEVDEFCRSRPSLLDPSLYPDHSLLFEWVTPNHRIVIHYERPELILTGGVCHDKNSLWTKNNSQLIRFDELLIASESLTTAVTERYSAQSIYELIDSLKDRKDIEGVVVRFAGERLVKLKCPAYLFLHRAKSNLTPSHLIELWLEWDRPGLDQFQAKITDNYDFECWLWARSTAERISSLVDRVNRELQQVWFFVADHRHLNRRGFAETLKFELDPSLESVAFELLDKGKLGDRFWKRKLKECLAGEFDPFYDSDGVKNTKGR